MLKEISHIGKARMGKHLFFWFLWVSCFTLLQSFGFGIRDYGAWLAYYLITLPLFVAHTYAIAYWLVPQYFFKRRYFLFFLGIVLLLILSSIGELIISNEFVWRMVKPENIQSGKYLNGSNILINGLGNEYIIIVFLSVKVVRFWNSKMGEKAELLNQKLATEIELLHYQSYPRFVLNVMDRMEQLAFQKSPQTSEMIIRLSNLMNNMTVGTTPNKINLQKEIELIRSYIDIQRMSFPSGYEVNFFVINELNGLQIPPFLFFQVVEEGFVVLDNFTEEIDCAIFIKTEPHYLLFSLSLHNESSFKHIFNQDVIGNCEKYLNCFYPEKYKVMSNFENNFVEVIIEIYL